MDTAVSPHRTLRPSRFARGAREEKIGNFVTGLRKIWLGHPIQKETFKFIYRDKEIWLIEVRKEEPPENITRRKFWELGHFFDVRTRPFRGSGGFRLRPRVTGSCTHGRGHVHIGHRLHTPAHSRVSQCSACAGAGGGPGASARAAWMYRQCTDILCCV